MGEAGLSPSEVGKEIAQHRTHSADHEQSGHERVRTIVEAVLLAVVAVLAAWSGYASAQWGTDSRLTLSRASTARVEANRFEMEALEIRNLDSSMFEAWFSAYAVDNEEAMRLAEHRFRPEYQVAFDAWMATDPVNDPDAPKGPAYMDEYVVAQDDSAREKNAEADELYAEGAEAGTTADEYVRTTVFLASVLFLVGISGHFRVRAARIGLVATGGAILLLSVALLATSPIPP
jgi:hypothetical protein